LKIHPLVLRRALSTAIGLCIALVVNYFFSKTHSFWLPVATVLVMQTTVRTYLQLALLRFIVLIVAVIVGSALSSILVGWEANWVFAFLFIVCCYWHSLNKINNSYFTTPLIAGVVFLLMIIPSETTVSLFMRVQDVMIGGFIGIMVGLLVFPGRPDVDFRLGVIPIIGAYEVYLNAISNLLLQKPNAEQAVELAKYEVERVLQTQKAFFPDWVYEPGFNIALREGHRHFLIGVEQLGGLLFAMHHAARYPLDAELVEKFEGSISLTTEHTVQFMQALVTILDLKKITSPLPDFIEDIANLESLFRKIIPLSPELLDLSSHYLHLASFIQDLKDFQKRVIGLAEALSYE